ncbi:Trm112 family protein [Parasphingopyxis marina]|uniref:UPF0434 protein H6P80_01630 n=1 Tax=Parasphingopyxis marina TaxID=2761622 RepID=A0A842HVA1_9SPHN|nr:Trm112 family protein [Parasphingopyxis marina]MBC2776311.1 Trm112 family protein [Parasphingopyxis marina]
MSERGTEPGFDQALLEILVCPLTRTRLRYDPATRELVSDAAGLAYPVRGGVPVMIAEEARQLAAASD